MSGCRAARGWVASLPVRRFGWCCPVSRRRGKSDRRFPDWLESASDQELIKLVQERPRDDPQGAAACELLVRRYEPMVKGCAARYRDSPESVEELMQVGYVGLLKAIANFDPEFGESLMAYAQPCVAGEIKRYFRDKRWHVRVRRSAQELRLRIRDEAPDLAQQLGRRPTDADLARHLQVSEAEFAEAQLASQAFQALSLDGPNSSPDEPELTLADLLGAEDQRLDVALGMNAVWQYLNELPEREQTLLMLRFYGNMTQDQIAAELGISQMHVSRLLSHSLSYLRDRINA